MTGEPPPKGSVPPYAATDAGNGQYVRDGAGVIVSGEHCDFCARAMAAHWNRWRQAQCELLDQRFEKYWGGGSKLTPDDLAGLDEAIGQ